MKRKVPKDNPRQADYRILDKNHILLLEDDKWTNREHFLFMDIPELSPKRKLTLLFDGESFTFRRQLFKYIPVVHAVGDRGSNICIVFKPFASVNFIRIYKHIAV